MKKSAQSAHYLQLFLLLDFKPLQIADMKASSILFTVLGAATLTGTVVTIYKRLKKLKDILVSPEPGTFKIVSINSKAVTFLINVNITNPADITVFIKKLKLQVFFNNKIVSESTLSNFSINSKGNTVITVPFNIHISAFYFLSQAYLTQQTIPLNFKGLLTASAIIQVSNMPFSFTIDAKEQIKNAGQLNGLKI